MKFLQACSKALHGLHLCSIDAALVGLVWQELFARSLNVELAPVHRVLLPISIWMAYTADRLWDARKYIPGTPSTARLRYHHQHAKTILTIWSLVFASSLIYSWLQLPPRTLLAGTLLMLLIQGYYLLSRLARDHATFRLTKDVATAGLFSCGSSFFILSQAPETIRQLPWLQVSFALLCLLNLHSVGLMERKLDRAQLEKTSHLLHKPLSTFTCLLLLAIGVSFILFTQHFPRFASAILLASFLQAAILLYATHLKQPARLRHLADWPLIMVLILAC